MAPLSPAQIRPSSSHPLHPSATEALSRIDAIDEITAYHYIWYKRHPDDNFTTIEDLQTEIYSELYPARPDSKSATLRQIAQSHEEMAQKLPKRWNSYSPLLIYNLFYGTCRLLLQLVRAPFTLFMLYYTISIVLQHHHSLIYRICCSLFTTFLMYELCFLDEQFFRFFGWQSIVKSGLYYSSTDPGIAPIFDRVKVLTTPITPAWGLFNGDLQTVLPCVIFDSLDLKIPYIRRWVTNTHIYESNPIDIAFPTNAQGQLYHDKTKSVLVAFHGLNGSSQAAYLQRHVTEYNKAGHTCIVLNSRGFGGGIILGTTCFNGCATDDLFFTILASHVLAGNCIQPDLCQYSRTSYSQGRSAKYSFKNCFTTPPYDLTQQYLLQTPIIAIGLSMGAIILTKYLVEYARYCGISSAVAFGSFGDTILTEKDVLQRKNWQTFLTSRLKFELLPAMEYILPSNNIDIHEVESAIILNQFDEIATAKVAGHSGRLEYYSHLSFARWDRLDKLWTKLLVINSADDPIIHIDGLEPCVTALSVERTKIKQQKNLALLVVPFGGHIATFTDWKHDWTWLAHASLEWNTLSIQHLQTQIQHNSLHESFPLIGVPEPSAINVLTHSINPNIMKKFEQQAQIYPGAGIFTPTIQCAPDDNPDGIIIPFKAIIKHPLFPPYALQAEDENFEKAYLQYQNDVVTMNNKHQYHDTLLHKHDNDDINSNHSNNVSYDVFQESDLVIQNNHSTSAVAVPADTNDQNSSHSTDTDESSYTNSSILSSDNSTLSHVACDHSQADSVQKRPVLNMINSA